MDDKTLIGAAPCGSYVVTTDGTPFVWPDWSRAYIAAADRLLARAEIEFFYGSHPKPANEKLVYGDPVMALKDCLSVFQSELDDNGLHPSDIPSLLRAAAKKLLSAAVERDATNEQDGVPDR